MVPNKESGLLIVQSQSDIPDDADYPVFVIDSKLARLSDNRYCEIETKLRDLEVDSGTSLPLYNIFSFMISSTHFNSKLLSLPQYIHLANLLHSEINQNNIEKIYLGEIQYVIGPVLNDIADNSGIEISNYTNSRARRKIMDKIMSIIYSIPILLDQLLASVTSRAESSSVETVFVPSTGRFKSMKSVLEQMTTDYAVVPNQSVISKKLRGFADSSLEDFDPTFSHQYVPFKCVLIQLKYLFLEYIPDELIRNKTETELVHAIEQEFGVRLDNTIGGIFAALYGHRPTNSLLNYFVYMEVLRQTEAKNVVVGLGYDAASEAIWLAGRHSNAETYDLPHTITPNPPQTGIYTDYAFVSGIFAEEYIKNNQTRKANKTEVLPTGRPYLEQLAERVETRQTQIEKPINILIATQPFNDEVRTKFVKESLRASKLLSIPTKITIKPHPNESKELYESINCGDNGFSIEESNLWKHLQNADLLLTLNSNVGLEAIIADTMTVTINLNQFIGKRPFPYSKEGGVPTLTSHAEVQDFFESLTIERMNQRKIDQRRFLDNNYVISGAAANVVSEIEDRSNGDTNN